MLKLSAAALVLAVLPARDTGLEKIPVRFECEAGVCKVPAETLKAIIENHNRMAITIHERRNCPGVRT